MLPTNSSGREGMGVTVSSSHFGFATGSSSRRGLLCLLQCEVSPMGDSPPQTSPLWLLPTGYSSSPTAPMWALSMVCSPSRTACSKHGSSGISSPASRPAPHGLLSQGVHRSCQKPVPAQACHRATTTFRNPLAVAWGPPQSAGASLLHCGPPWFEYNPHLRPSTLKGREGEQYLHILKSGEPKRVVPDAHKL